MYSLVSTCIRPQVYDEAEEIIIPPPNPIRAVHNQANSSNTMSLDKQLQKSSGTGPLAKEESHHHVQSPQPNSTIKPLPEQTPTSLSYIPSIEVLNNTQSSSASASEIILIQSPSRTQARTLFVKSPNDDGNSNDEAMCIPFCLNEEDECDDNNQHANTSMSFMKKEIPLYYSPLIANEVKENKTLRLKLGGKGRQSDNENTKNNHLSTSNQLKSHAERWEYQSSLAGSHSQNSHVLDVSHLTNISLQSLKCGITPNMAKGITEFKCSLMEHKSDLPSILDLVINMFPNLSHFTLVEKSNSVNDDYSKENHEYATPRNKDPCYGNEYDDNHVKVYSADGDDDQETGDNEYELATASCQKASCLPRQLQYQVATWPPLSSSIATQALQMAEKESERMKRLYILYRMPNLVSINGQIVTEEERKLSKPISPSGKKVKRQEWLTQAMADNKDSFATRDVLGSTLDARFIRDNSLYFSSEEEEEDSKESSLEQSTDEMNLTATTTTPPDRLDAQPKSKHRIEQLCESNLSTNPKSLSPSATIIKTPQRNPNQHLPQPRMNLTSPSRSNLIGIFPHTGKSVSTPASTIVNSDSRPVMHKSQIYTSHSDQPLKSPNHEVLKKDVSSSHRHDLLQDQIPSSVKNTTMPPSKTNLDSFIAKDKARERSQCDNTIVTPSEATDVAIAGHLLSKYKLGGSHTDKENLVNFTSSSEEKDNKSRRKEKKERRSMPLVGSTVKVKLKKSKRQSLPPPSPASTFREFPKTQKKKGRTLASFIDQMDDDDDDDDDDENEEHGNDFELNSIPMNP